MTVLCIYYSWPGLFCNKHKQPKTYSTRDRKCVVLLGWEKVKHLRGNIRPAPSWDLVFSDGSVSKESTCNRGDPGEAVLIPGSRRYPGGGKWQPTPVFLPGKSHGQRSLADYSWKGCKESNTLEQLSTCCEMCPTMLFGEDCPRLFMEGGGHCLWLHGGGTPLFRVWGSADLRVNSQCLLCQQK